MRKNNVGRENLLFLIAVLFLLAGRRRFVEKAYRLMAFPVF